MGVKPLTLVRPSWVTARSSAGSSWLQLTMRTIKSLSSTHQPSRLTRWPITDIVLHSSSTSGGLVAGLHNLCHPTIRDGSTWSKFGASGEHGDDADDDEDIC